LLQKAKHLFCGEAGEFLVAQYTRQKFYSRAASANPRPAGRMWPLKLFSAALLLPQKLIIFKKNQENH
jgi:hypothetical protein